MNIIDKQTGEIIGNVVTNQSMTLEQAMELAGFEYVEGDNESGWSKDGGRTLYDESTAEMVYNQIQFAIPTDPDHYGSEFQESMIDEFERFAENFLEKLGYEVKTYRTEVIPSDDDYDLRLKVWTAYCNS